MRSRSTVSVQSPRSIRPWIRHLRAEVHSIVDTIRRSARASAILRALLIAGGIAPMIGCATLFTSPRTSLHLASQPDSAAVYDATGRLLGVTPLQTRSRARDQRLSVHKAFHKPAQVQTRRRLKWVTYLNLINPIGWAIDLWSGAAWEYRRERAQVQLERQSLDLDTATVQFAEWIFLRRMSTAARVAQCNPVIAQYWLDESDRLFFVAPSSDTVRNEIIRRVEEEVASAQPQLEQMCQRRNELLDSLAVAQAAISPMFEWPPDSVQSSRPASVQETEREAEDTLSADSRPPTEQSSDPPVVEPSSETPSVLDIAIAACKTDGFGICVTFGFSSSRLSVQADSLLSAIARHVSSIGFPHTLVITGTADAAGDSLMNEQLGLSRAEAAASRLAALGIARSVIKTETCGEASRCQLVPDSTRHQRGAHLNRRVRFSLQPRSIP